jgi:hypothetical protein
MFALITAALLASGAYAEDGPKADPAPVLVGFRGVGEIWQDPFVVESYRSSRFSGGWLRVVRAEPLASGRA